MVTDIIRLQQLKFYHRYINGNLPEYFSRLGIQKKRMFIDIIQEIPVERANTELARKSLRFSIIHVINYTLFKHILMQYIQVICL